MTKNRVVSMVILGTLFIVHFFLATASADTVPYTAGSKNLSAWRSQ